MALQPVGALTAPVSNEGFEIKFGPAAKAVEAKKTLASSEITLINTRARRRADTEKDLDIALVNAN